MEEELVGAEPWDHDTGDNLSNAIFPEAQIVCSDDRRVDEVHSGIDKFAKMSFRLNIQATSLPPSGIGTVLVDNKSGVGVILQALAHFLAIAGRQS